MRKDAEFTDYYKQFAQAVVDGIVNIGGLMDKAVTDIRSLQKPLKNITGATPEAHA